MEYMKEHRYNNIDQFTFIYFIQLNSIFLRKKKKKKMIIRLFPNSLSLTITYTYDKFYSR